MIKILHIDDKIDMSKALDALLEEHHDGAVLKWYGNFKKGVEALRKSPSEFNGIILDAKCFLDDNDEILDEQNVTKAINDIEEVFSSNNIWMPYCVLSGFKEKIGGYLRANDIPGYDKDAQELEAINYILESQNEVTKYLFEKEFPDLLTFLKAGALEEHSANILLQMYGLVRERNIDSSIIKTQIAQIRPMLEKVIKMLYEGGMYDDEPLVPEEYVSQSGARLQVNNIVGCSMYLAGHVARGRNKNYERSPVWPEFIHNQCLAIYNVTSTVGSHTNKDTGSIYTLKAMFYSLCDILMWYKTFVKNFS